MLLWPLLLDLLRSSRLTRGVVGCSPVSLSCGGELLPRLVESRSREPRPKPFATELPRE